MADGIEEKFDDAVVALNDSRCGNDSCEGNSCDEHSECVRLSMEICLASLEWKFDLMRQYGEEPIPRDEVEKYSAAIGRGLGPVRRIEDKDGHIRNYVDLMTLREGQVRRNEYL